MGNRSSKGSISDDVNMAVASSGDPDKWRVPMPVRWIYVLRDGTLTIPQKESSGLRRGPGRNGVLRRPERRPRKTRSSGGLPSGPMTILRRSTSIPLADTASRPRRLHDGYDANSYAGSFWDTPRFYTNFDIGQTNPNDGSTCFRVSGRAVWRRPSLIRESISVIRDIPRRLRLGAVFARLLTSEQIYKLSPRFNGGGSQGGTYRTSESEGDRVGTEVRSASMLRWTNSCIPEARGGGKRETNDEYVGVSGAITPDKLEKMKFFLTAHSRAPDLNLFGRPRVAIWPVNQSSDESTGRNAFDRAIAFCSTVGGKKFIFTRAATPSTSGAFSTTMDILSSDSSANVTLMKYPRADRQPDSGLWRHF